MPASDTRGEGSSERDAPKPPIIKTAGFSPVAGLLAGTAAMTEVAQRADSLLLLAGQRLASEFCGSAAGAMCICNLKLRRCTERMMDHWTLITLRLH